MALLLPFFPHLVLLSFCVPPILFLPPHTSALSKMLPTILRRIPARSVLSSRAASTVAVSQVSPNIKVTAFDEGAHTSSLSVILKAGSRFENAAGVANVLKNSAFKVSGSRCLTEMSIFCLALAHLTLRSPPAKLRRPSYRNVAAAIGSCVCRRPLSDAF